MPGLRILIRLRRSERSSRMFPITWSVLHAPSAAITCPYELHMPPSKTRLPTGADLMLESKVTGISYGNGLFSIETSQGTIQQVRRKCRGLYSDMIAAMAGDRSFSITPRKGEYMLLDKSQGHLVSSVVFQTPTEKGKGTLVTPGRRKPAHRADCRGRG